MQARIVGRSPDRLERQSRPRGWFGPVQACWLLLAAVLVGLFVAGIPSGFAALRSACTGPACDVRQLSPENLRTIERLGLSGDSYAATVVACSVVIMAGFAGMGALIFWRRTDDRIALLTSLALVSFGAARDPARGPSLPAHGAA